MADTTDVNNLRVVTAIRFATSTLNALSHITFLYDPNWSSLQQEVGGATLPFAFFETIKDEIQQQNDVSEKRIILYEPGATSTDVKNSFRPSVLNTVSDNIVTKPLTHKIDCLVPYGFVTKVFSRISDFIDSAIGVFSYNDGSEFKMSFSMIQAAITASSNFLEIATAFAPYNNYMYNRNSLLAMARNRSILKMKAWDSWDYKYVVISNIVFNKIGTEDDYIRCSIELKEIPILSIANKQETTYSSATYVDGDSAAAIATEKSDGVFVKVMKTYFDTLSGVLKEVLS